MKPLITHDWLESIGGSENVVYHFQKIYPDSEIFTLWNNSSEFKNVKESFLKYPPLRNRKLLSIIPSLFIWSNLKTKHRPDFILSSSHSFAHQSFINKCPDLKKLVYCHSPARYLYEPNLDKRGNSPIKKILGTPLKLIDYRRAQNIHAIAANSHFVKERIKNAWGLNASVIYPPVNTKKIVDGGLWRKSLTTKELNILNDIPKNYILGASRLVDYKRLDIVLRVGKEKNMPVVIVGNGRLERKLKNLSTELGVDSYFISNASLNFLYTLYQEAFVYIFPAIEDFGIMPVECMATGTPVITAPIGGATESVKDGVSGFNAKDFSIKSFAELVDKVSDLDKGEIIQQALLFSNELFIKNIRKWVKDSLKQ